MQWTWKNKWTLLGFYVRVGEAKRSEAVSLVKLVPRAQFWWKSFYYCLSTKSGTSQGLISSVCLQLWTMLPERKKEEEEVFVGIRYSKGGQLLNTATLHPVTSYEEVVGVGWGEVDEPDVAGSLPTRFPLAAVGLFPDLWYHNTEPNFHKRK